MTSGIKIKHNLTHNWGICLSSIVKIIMINNYHLQDTFLSFERHFASSSIKTYIFRKGIFSHRVSLQVNVYCPIYIHKRQGTRTTRMTCHYDAPCGWPTGSMQVEPAGQHSADPPLTSNATNWTPPPWSGPSGQGGQAARGWPASPVPNWGEGAEPHLWGQAEPHLCTDLCTKPLVLRILGIPFFLNNQQLTADMFLWP